MSPIFCRSSLYAENSRALACHSTVGSQAPAALDLEILPIYIKKKKKIALGKRGKIKSKSFTFLSAQKKT